MKKQYLILPYFLITSCTYFQTGHLPASVSEAKREVSSTRKKNEIVFFDAHSLEAREVKLVSFDLNSQLTDLKAHIERFVSLYQYAKKSDNSTRVQYVQGDGDLREPYNKFEIQDKGLYYAAKKMLALIAEMDERPELVEVNKYQIAQLSRAIFQKYTPPNKDEYELLALPITILKTFNYTTVSNDNNLKTVELSPQIRSEFINENMPREAENLYSYRMIRWQDLKDCRYLKPKTGYGVHGGFHIKCGDQAFKVKFGNEIYSGSFNSRIYSRLGYRVPLINYAPKLKIKYDRRMIKEYNERAGMDTKVTLLWQKLGEIEGTIMRDPFGDIEKFVLKNGQEISSDEMKTKLLKSFDKKKKPVDQDFNLDYEEQIDSVILETATLTLKDETEDAVTVGPWKADDLNYSRLKEVRGLMVLNAWLGNFDMRKDNLAVYIENPKSSDARIKVGFSDSGSGLGKATFGLKKISSSSINDMLWEVTETYSNMSSESNEPDRIQLIGLMNIESNKAYQYINMSDAQWMLDKICQFSKSDLQHALVATGMSSAEVVLATEKLLSRRNKMLKDFLASKEMVSRCYVPANKKINYDPKVNGVIKVKNAAGEEVSAPTNGRTISKGVLQ